MENTAANEKKWTPSQSAAIDFSGKGLLMSAGAGSGKTATLTEKVCRLVCDEENGIPISQMIIVTFTRAAAGELRERISKKLTEKINEKPTPFLVKQLIDLESAEISTILAFFLRAIKPHFSSLGLPPSFTVAEEAAIRVLKEKVMADTVDNFFESNDSEFCALADTLASSRSEDAINGKLLEIADKMASKGLGAEAMAKWASELEQCSDSDYFISPHGKMLKEHTEQFAKHYGTVFSYYNEAFLADESARKSYSNALDADTYFVKILLQLVEEGVYEKVKSHLETYSPARLGSNKTPTSFSERYKESRDAFKTDVKALMSKYSADTESLSAVQKKTAKLCRGAAKVLAEYFAAFENEKKERGTVDYSDLEIYAEKLFCNEDGSPTAAALDFSKNFRCIFIDEYQDTNRVQDRVFSALSHGMKRFMVGDVKQSIYAFRGSEPYVFTSYREKWEELIPSEDTEQSENREAIVFMNENFRSDSTVIDFVNLVSSYMFPHTATPFEEGDKLKASRICKEENYKASKAEVCIIEKESARKGNAETDDETELSDGYVNYEAEYTADRIEKMLEGETLGDGSLVRPSDVAILLRSFTKAAEFANALKQRGIPVKDMATGEFFEQSEVLLVLCILNAIDNPLRDVYLAGAMKSPVFSFSVDDMIRLLDFRNKNSESPLWYCVEAYVEEGRDEALREKCKAFAAFLSDFREKASGTSAAKLLSELYDTLALYSLTDNDAENGANGRRIRANLTLLYEYSRNFEKDSYGGLHGFIVYLEELMEGKVEGSGEADDSDAVSIMTIHKSKGLEFPVCFICECAKKINVSDLTADVLFDSHIGLAMKLQDDSGLVKCETPLRAALADKIREQLIFESTRVLYVAMTRAVEKLIVTMTVSNVEKAKASAFEKYTFHSDFGKKKSSSFADFILPAVMGALYENRSSFFELKTLKHTEVNTASGFEREEELPEVKEDETLLSLYRERLSFRYEKDFLADIPAKLTVSKLKPALLDEDEELFDIESYIESVKNTDGAIYETAERLMGLSDGEDVFKGEAEETAPLPKFLSDKKTILPTDIGTATHVFLQFADFDNLRKQGVEAELDRLVSKRFITEEMASLVNLRQIEAFRESALLKALETAKEVRREFRFNVALPAGDFTVNGELSEKLYAEGTLLTVQGVVDLVFIDENDRLILVDYKTDALTKYELENRAAAEKKLRERHGAQLGYYKLALEKMYEREVTALAVYSLPLGDTVKL